MVKKLKGQKQKQIKKNHSKSDEYTVVLEDIKSQFQIFGEVLGHVSDTVDQHTKELGEIKEKLINVEMELEFVKEELSVIRHNQVTRDEFKLLETRVARLERAK